MTMMLAGKDPAAVEVLVADRIVAAANNRVVAYNKALKAVQEYNRLPPSPSAPAKDAGTREGKSAGGSAKGDTKGQGNRKAPSNFPLSLGFATWHHEPCSMHHATAVTANKRGTATFMIWCPRTNGGCGGKPRVCDITNVVEYPTLKKAQDALERDRSACTKGAAAKAKAAAGPS
ncbi:hypothetical protein TSOC_010646 [Tetrabaena socialis]|uniref:Uncharacterized protein n=1 Tax=Tetrabaena socialis TaxID=47790 RepID=A0A2J7ZSQ7_9CHLO|nr:hypothetical protein TSOC_010646 [Tetrabaena socialis]|eukprot:PNH03303.1 hypothetical protein TSOC_010646 [Tetrabaena socialis]